MGEFQEEMPPWKPGGVPVADPAGDASRKMPATDRDSYDRFVESLHARVRDTLSTELDTEIQVEIAKLIGLLMEMPPKEALGNCRYFELALDGLAAKHPNMTLAVGIRRELEFIRDRRSHGVTRYVSYICGSTPLNASISAMLTALALSLVILLAMIAGHRTLLQSIAGTELYSSLSNGSVALLIVAVHSAFVGGIVSILARIQDFLARPMVSPPLLYISIIRKPFLAAAFVIMVYSVLKVGLVSFPGVDFTGPTAPYMAWALGFLCGFSERFAPDFIQNAGGRFGDAPDPGVNS